MMWAMQHNLQIIPILAFEDNYIWLIHNGKQAVVVDPGDANPVLSVLKALSLTLVTILVTHHHHDHIDGVAVLIKNYPQAKVYAPKLEDYQFSHSPVSEPDAINIDALNLTFKVIDCAGHTQGHVAYYAQRPNGQHWLFSGDVIFAAGCGFVMNDAYQQAFNSLQKIANLPPQTHIYCTHEYTLKNIQFARTLEPNNAALLQRQQDAVQKRLTNQPTLPTTVALELATNPFLRCHSDEIVRNLKADKCDKIEIFTLIRMAKNNYIS
ncbi:MAG TPA: hydroxyacylglutathione hydrolase [Methylotenera sp.]|nr:hydroxyacylglutathione hydrolase [Methylotenera sp.]HPH04484.1 hydroxyacylglutathione hydrolase [Methylotenera sp.]